MSKKQIKLNLGCGYDQRRGFINIDVDPQVKPDLVHDLTRPLPFGDSTVTKIMLQDVLEHLTVEAAKQLLAECSRVLVNEGTMEVRVPNVLAIIRKFFWQPDLLMLYIYGDTSRSGVWGAHKYGYTPRLLSTIAVEHNLYLELSEKDDTNWVFKLKKDTDLVEPEIKIKGQGWHPKNLSLQNQLQKFKGHQIVVLTDSNSFLLTPLLKFINGQTVVWCLSQPPSQLWRKLFLKPLSRWVELVIVKNSQSDKFAKNVLKYSHLRISNLK